MDTSKGLPPSTPVSLSDTPVSKPTPITVTPRPQASVRLRSPMRGLKSTAEDSFETELLHAIDRFFFAEVPENFPLRAKVRIKLQVSRVGHCWGVLQAVASLLACVFYVLMTYGYDYTEGMLEWVLTTIFTADLLLFWYAAEHRLAHLCRAATVLDILTVLPQYLAVIESTLSTTDGRITISLHFLRFAKVLRIMRVLRTFRLADSRSFSQARRQTLILILTVLTLVFLSAGLVQMVEPITFGNALYFMVVTMSTVGYGDIHPQSGRGRAIVSCIIIAAWILVPIQISKLYEVLARRSAYRTMVNRKKEFVLVVGEVANVYKLHKFILEFYHPDRSIEARRVNLVIAGPNEPSRELKSLIMNPLFERRVSYVKASIMKEPDLERLAMDQAKACFVLSDWLGDNTAQEDSRALVRTLMLNNFSPQTPTFVQLSDPSGLFQVSRTGANHCMCADSLKLSIFGLSAAYPGASTVVSNLMVSFTSSTIDGGLVRRREQEPWLVEYTRGMAFELYSHPLPPSFQGLTFSEAVELIYTESDGQILLLGVKEEEEEVSASGLGGNVPNGAPATTSDKLYCNPGHGYIFHMDGKVTIHGIVLASDFAEVCRIDTMVFSDEADGHVSPPSTPVSAASSSTSPKAVAINMEPSPPTSPCARRASNSTLRMLFRPLFGSQAPPVELPSSGEGLAEQGIVQLQVVPMAHATSPASSDAASEAMGRERGDVLVALRRQSSPSLVRSDSASSLRTVKSLRSSMLRSTSDTQLSTRGEGPTTPEPPLAKTTPHHARFASLAMATRLTAASAKQSSSSPPPTNNPLLGRTQRQLLAEDDPELLSTQTPLDDVVIYIKDAHFYRRTIREVSKLRGHTIVVCQSATLSSFSHFLKAFQSGTRPPPLLIMVPQLQALFKEDRNNERARSGQRGARNASSTRRRPRKLLEELRRFSNLYIMEGDAITEEDLRSAGLMHARMCVLLADKSSTKLMEGHFVDNAILRRFLSVQKFLYDNQQNRQPSKPDDPTPQQHQSHHRHRADFSLLVEVQSSSTLNVMDRYQEKIHQGVRETLCLLTLKQLQQQDTWKLAGRSPAADFGITGRGGMPSNDAADRLGGGEVNFGIRGSYTTSFFASGRGFLTHIFDTLPCQAYYNRDVVRFLELMIGHQLDPDPQASSNYVDSRPFLSRIPMPRGFLSSGARRDPAASGAGENRQRSPPPLSPTRTFAELLTHCLTEMDGLIPIALYRTVNGAAGSAYVATAPEPTTILRPDDAIFVLNPTAEEEVGSGAGRTWAALAERLRKGQTVMGQPPVVEAASSDSMF